MRRDWGCLRVSCTRVVCVCRPQHGMIIGPTSPHDLGDGLNVVLESEASSAELSEFLSTNRVPGTELCEFLLALYLCAKRTHPASLQSSPSLAQNSPNSPSSLFRRSALETAFSPFSIIFSAISLKTPDAQHFRPLRVGSWCRFQVFADSGRKCLRCVRSKNSVDRLRPSQGFYRSTAIGG